MNLFVKRVILGLFLLPILVNAQSGGSTKPKCQQLLDKAYVEFQIGNFKGAADIIKKAEKCDPNFTQIYALEAEIFETLQDSAKTLRAHRLGIEKDSLYQPSYYYFASYLFRIGKFNEALAMVNRYDKVPKMVGFQERRDGASASMKSKVDRLRSSIEMAKAEMGDLLKMEITNMGPLVNSSMHEYWPGMPIDGKTFVMTRLVDGQEDFYYSIYGEKGWEKSRPMPGRLNTPNNEGTSSLFHGSNEDLIYFSVCNQDGNRSCELYVSKLDNGKWGPRKNMGPEVNSVYWDCQPSISGDGNTLVFASARPGGFGGKDLWKAVKVNGVWTKPVNLGPDINTAFDEEAPYIHYDGTTLYFASSGHPGHGGHDIFLSRLNEEGKWGKPENLGKGVNTAKDDVGFYVDAFGKKAYFASDRDGGQGGLDIYSVNLIDKFKPKPVNYMLGKVIDKVTRAPITAKVKLVNLATQKVIFEDSTSSFLIPIVVGRNYAFQSTAKGYLIDSRNFQPSEAGIDKPFLVEAELEPIKAQQTFTMANIFFDIDKFDLKPESETDLMALFQLMKTNPAMKIEISGHTDNTGSEVHNKELSANRALSLKQYLEKRGIALNRIVTQGYGSTKPVATNSTEEGKAQNRRIEVKVLAI